MSTLSKYRQLKAAQRRKDRETRQVEREENKEFFAERKRLYNKLVSFIKPFNNKKINGLKLQLAFNPRKREVILTINKKDRFSFMVETSYESCHCSYCSDGAGAHEGTYSNDVNVYTIGKRGKREDQQLFLYRDEDDFVMKFDHFLEEYIRDQEFNKLIDDFSEEVK